MATKVKRTRNLETMTEAEYWGKVRSALRKAFAYWKPAEAALKAAQCGHKLNTETGRHNQAFRCAGCDGLFLRGEMYKDHIDPVGTLKAPEDLAPFLASLTEEDPSKFQALCKPCHQRKTNSDRAVIA